MKQGTITRDMPSYEQLKNEYDRVRYKNRFSNVLRSTVFTLIVVSAVAVLVAVLLLPVLRVYGHSMNNTLEEGDVIISLKGSGFEVGDVCGFYYNNKILIKRVIANAGDWVDIDEDGNVYVNGQKIDEPYLKEKAFGDCNIELPYQVPENRIFVMGDNRAVSIDSRNSTIGCIGEEQIVGKIVFRVWPLSEFGPIQ